MRQETDILLRINDLRLALRDMKSEDVRKAIQAAIQDCERQLGIDPADSKEQSPGFAIEVSGPDRSLVHGQREQLHVGLDGTLEPVGQFVGADVTDEGGELGDGVVGAGEHHPASLLLGKLRNVTVEP